MIATIRVKTSPKPFWTNVSLSTQFPLIKDTIRKTVIIAIITKIAVIAAGILST